VKRFGRASVAGASGSSMRDFHNYLVTSARIDGDWSDPVYLNSSGFDPSLFHDDDGRKVFAERAVGPSSRKQSLRRNCFAGILGERTQARRQRVNIFQGTSLGFTEAPHLYKRNGWYYLLTAEGGTNWNHAVTMARSRHLTGPYELHPDSYIMSARQRPDLELQRAGHASLVETQQGETYMAYLVGRPLRNRGRCTLGRETAIQKMQWGADGWLRTIDGEGIPTIETPAPRLGANSFPASFQGEDFDQATLPVDFQWLRTPHPEKIFSLTARPGFLRLIGRETLGSHYCQSLVARRQQSHCFSASTVIEFEPEHFQQLAGLVCYYNSTKFHYLYLSHDEVLGKHLRAMSCAPDSMQADSFTPPIAIPTEKPVHLRVEVDYERMHFAYRVEGVDNDWQWLSQQFDASILSDECLAPGQAHFTGAFVGMACQDLAGTGKPADFHFFKYYEREFWLNPTSAAAK
jgi:xylan 1,4-beta-xylosidase